MENKGLVLFIGSLVASAIIPILFKIGNHYSDGETYDKQLALPASADQIQKLVAPCHDAGISFSQSTFDKMTSGEAEKAYDHCVDVVYQKKQDAKKDEAIRQLVKPTN